MPINEIIQACGSWSVALREDTPRTILDDLDYFGHVAVHSARQFHPDKIGDALLDSARYVGVLRERQYTGSQGQFVEDAGPDSPLAASSTSTLTIAEANLISGPGLAMWLGDEDDKGPVIVPPGVSLTGALFTEGVRALLPPNGSIREGTFYPLVGAWTGSYIFTTCRRALTDFCTYFSDDYGEAEWKINPNGTLDAGSVNDLYVTEPQAIIARKADGQDLNLRGLRGSASTSTDMDDFSTEVIVLAEGDGPAVATGRAQINPALNDNVDLFGNTVVMTRMISQEGTDASNAPASAQLQLNRFTGPRRSLELSSDEIDMRGLFGCGDYVWLYDPDNGLEDHSHEVVFQGRRVYPTKLRVTELSWPITENMGVSFRRQDGTWIDLTDYVYFEPPDSVDVIVGDLSRTLLGTTAGTEAVGARPKADSSIPGKIVWRTPFDLSAYQSKTGITRAQVALRWSRPLNTDGTAIVDGHHYEIRLRTSSHQILPVTWSYLQQADLAWIDLVQWDGMLPAVEGPWQHGAIGFDQIEFLIGDLTPGVPYDVQIRAVDSATPPNYGTWSDTATFETFGDPFPPSEPAPPSVASSIIAVQVTHLLGKSSGGTFNLEADLHHLEVHAAFSSAFTPDESTLLGKLLCNNGTILSNTPVVGTFQIAITTDVWIKVVAVDDAGNRSSASSGAQSSMLLIDDQYISNLTVSKLTAGELTANVIVGAEIATAFSGARFGMNPFGAYAFDPYNRQTFQIDSQTGDVVMIGTLLAEANNSGVLVAPSNLVGEFIQVSLPGIYFYAEMQDFIGDLPPGGGRIYGTPLGGATLSMPTSVVVASSEDDNYRCGAVSLQDAAAAIGYWQAYEPTQAFPFPSIAVAGGFLVASPNLVQVGMFASDTNSLDGGLFAGDRTSVISGFSPYGANGLAYGYRVDVSPTTSVPVLGMDGPYTIGTFSTAQTLWMNSGSFSGTGGVSFSYGATMLGTRYGFASVSSVTTMGVTSSSTTLNVSTGTTAGTIVAQSWATSS